MHWFRVKKTAWGLPDIPRVDKKINMIPYIIAFYKDNYLKLKFVRGKKVDILTKEANAKQKFGSNPKIVRPEKGLFLGAPCNA